MKKIILTSIAMSIIASYSSHASNNLTQYFTSYSVGGDHLEVTAKNDGKDLVLPNGYSLIKATVADSAWSERVILPSIANEGDTVIVRRTSLWDSYILLNSSQMPIDINSILQFTFNGTEWMVLEEEYHVTPIAGTNLNLPDGYRSIKVDIKDVHWAATTQLPENPNIGDVVTVNRTSGWSSKVVGQGVSQILHKDSSTVYSFDGNNWNSSSGDLFEVTPFEGNDIHLPNDEKNIEVVVKNGLFANTTYLPENSPLGTVVTIKRSSDWDTFANDGIKNVLIPSNSVSKFVWNGDIWKNVSIENNNITRLQNSSTYEVHLTNTKPESIDSISIVPTNTESVVRPSVVTLKDMSIESGYFVNKTPYTVNGIFVEKNGLVTLIEFTRSIGGYSKGYIGEQYDDHTITNQSNIANNKYDFESNNTPGGYPKIRHANEIERDSVERIQMYERFWINSPKTLSEITQRIEEQCDINNGYSECRNYPESTLDYTTDMYFAQSLSGLTSQFWIDPSVWGLATAPGKNLVKSNTSNVMNLWMHPTLMENMLSDNASTVIDAEQGLIHEYYHNLGFGHSSGWASYLGIDDLFGEKAYNEYRHNLNGKMVNTNIITNVEKIDGKIYKISLNSIGSINDLSMRILSSEPVTATVVQQDSSCFTLKFDESPDTDIYVSIFSSESSQMSTIKLTNFVESISGQSGLSNLHNVFGDIIEQYEKVYISTANGSWVSEFTLPDAADGKEIVFSSSAGWNSRITYNGKTDVLRTNDRFEYYRVDGAWVRK